MTVLFPPAPPKSAPRNIADLLDQGKWWNGAESWIKVKKMTPAHRANAARLMLARAVTLAARYEASAIRYMYDAPDDVWNSFENENARRAADPEAWVRSTKLHRSLTKNRGQRPDMNVEDFTVTHFMDEHLLDACGSADPAERLVVTPVIEDVTCTPCGRIARKANR